MPTKGSCLNLITSGSSIQKVTSITPSKAQFLLVLYYTLAGYCLIRSSNVRSISPSNIQPRSLLNGARRFNHWYYVLKFNNMQWWFHQSAKIRMVGLLVLMGSSRLSNWLSCCILCLLEQLLNRHIWCERMLHQIRSIPYGLQIIMWI